MSILKYKIFIVFISLVSLSCSSVKVYTDRDKDTDISKYSTYTWEPYQAIEKKGANPLFYNELNDARIKDAVNRELNKRSLAKVEAHGELVLHYHIILEAKATPVTLDPDEHDYSSHWSRRNVDVYQYTEGTLIIDLMDEKQNKIVWRGWIVGVVDASNAANSEEAINKAVKLIFEKFPH